MDGFNPTAAFKLEKINTSKSNPEDGVFDFEKYRYDLAQALRSIRNGNKEKEIAPDLKAAEQYLEQERIKSRYIVALELHKRKENELRKKDYEHRIDLLIQEYNAYMAEDESCKIGKDKLKDREQIPEPNYDVLGMSIS